MSREAMVAEVNQEAIVGAQSCHNYRPKNDLPQNQHLPPRERLG